jgi:hypothetical protein
VSGEYLISWSFLLIDIPLVAVSAAAGLFVMHRLRWGGLADLDEVVQRVVCCVTYSFPERGEIFESLPVVRLDIALVLVAAGVTTLVYWGNAWWNCSGDGAI